MKSIVAAILFVLSVSASSGAGAVNTSGAVVMFKHPQCGCCEQYGEYLRQHGFVVKVVETAKLDAVKRQRKIPRPLEACHTLELDGYLIEGHVPIAVIMKLLKEKPDIRGLSLPGMPQGSPGMSGIKTGAFTVYAFREGERPFVYAVE